MIGSRLAIALSILLTGACTHYLAEPRPSGAIEYLRIHRGIGPNEQLGSAVCPVGDWNDDGRADYAIGSNGHARIVSGATGETLLQLLPPPESGRFGAALCPLPDIDGDGRPDFAISAPGEPAGRMVPGQTAHAGVVEIRVGRDGRVLRTLQGISGSEEFGVALACLENRATPSDSILLAACVATAPDGQVTAPVLAFRCGDGALVYRFDDPESQSAPPDISSCGDLDGDGIPEFAVPDWSRGLRIVSGRNGRVIRTLELSVRGHAMTTDDTFDFDRDGTPDVAVAESVIVPMTRDGRVEIYSGRDGHRLWSARCLATDGACLRVGATTALLVTEIDALLLFVPPAVDPIRRLALDSWGIAHVALVGDVDGDDRPDVAIANDFDAGFVGIVSSRTIERLMRR
jgi:hypothetical protein